MLQFLFERLVVCYVHTIRKIYKLINLNYYRCSASVKIVSPSMKEQMVTHLQSTLHFSDNCFKMKKNGGKMTLLRSGMHSTSCVLICTKWYLMNLFSCRSCVFEDYEFNIVSFQIIRNYCYDILFRVFSFFFSCYKLIYTLNSITSWAFSF